MSSPNDTGGQFIAENSTTNCNEYSSQTKILRTYQ